MFANITKYCQFNEICHFVAKVAEVDSRALRIRVLLRIFI